MEIYTHKNRQGRPFGSESLYVIAKIGDDFFYYGQDGTLDKAFAANNQTYQNAINSGSWVLSEVPAYFQLLA